MQNKQQHIIFKLITLIVVVAVLLPSIIKFSHALENHKHDVCTDYQTSHFHTIDLDCEFYKFNINTLASFTPLSFDIFIPNNNFSITTSQYLFISEYQRLGFALRGPPQVV
ncbi:hypothetical protein [Lacinutrix salivirga]